MPIRVQMPNGTVRPFREGTPQSVIRKAQADMLADMKASGHYDDCDFGDWEGKSAPTNARKVAVTQTPPDEDDDIGAPPVPQAQAAPTPAPAANMPLSQQGDRFLKKADGNSITDIKADPATDIYIDGTGNPTFGYGHKIEQNDLQAMQQKLAGMSVDQRQAYAEQLYGEDVQTHYDQARKQIGAQAFDALPQNQRDALVIDHFNTGQVGPQMAQAIQRGDVNGAANQFNSWNGTQNGVKQKMSGLVTRQLNTRDLWLNGNYNANHDKNDRLHQQIMNGGHY